MYNFSMSGTNATTKTEVPNIVPFMTKVHADAKHSITSTIIWKWARRTIIRFCLFVIVLLFVYSDYYEKVPRTPKCSSYSCIFEATGYKNLS